MARSDHPYQTPNRYPEEPQGSSRWLFFLIGGLIAFCALAACSAAGYFFLQPILAASPVASPPAVPTLEGGEAEAATGEAATGEAATSPAAEATTAPDGEDVEEPDAPAATSTLDAETDPGVELDVVRAVQVSDALQIDGSGSDWPSTSTTTSAFRVFATESWDGTNDLQAEWRLAWDADNLYLLVQVVDDNHVQTQTGTQIFRGDSVEIQIDTAPEQNAQRVNPATFQFILSPGNFDELAPSAVRFRGTAGGDVPEAPGHSVRVAAQETDDGYRLEAAIPWQDMNVEPSDGRRLGVALNANDNDTPDTAEQEVMMSHVPGRTLTNPATWGTMLLE
jgi:hypothetical protein